MSYCINPGCPNPQNPDDASDCNACGSRLLLDERYRAIRPLAQRKSCSSNAIFVQVFEATDAQGTAKVLKVLYDGDPGEVSRFTKEAKVLSQLSKSCRGLPKVESEGYFPFDFSPKNRSRPVHCLVMEKIRGTNLQKWVQEQGPIDENQAVEWLRQLVAILDQVHKQGFFHRDIKPANIIRRKRSGNLVLIDFGAVRETTETYEIRVGLGEVTRVYSVGYTPLEQLQGRAVPQSDFFSLGRTFVYLLTGQEPSDLPPDPRDRDKLIWRDKATCASVLAALIDRLMAQSPENRPRDAQAILQQLDKAKSGNNLPQLVTIEKGDSGNNLPQLVTIESNSENSLLQLNKIEKCKSGKKWMLYGLAGGFVTSAIVLLVVFITKKPLCSDFTDVPNVPKGLFNYGGSTTWAPIFQQLNSAIMAARPEFRLRYMQSDGSGKGIKMLLEGQLTFSQFSSVSPT